MIRMTYAEYDRLEELCEKIREENEKSLSEVDDEKMFYMLLQRPTLAQLKEMNIEKNIDKYFPYLFFYYTQKFDSELADDLEEYQEYREFMAYLKSVIDRNIEFIDDEE